MVIAVLPIAAILIALAGVLAYWGGDALGKWITRIIPNWGIPGIGNIRSGAESLISEAIVGLEYWFDGLVGIFGDLLMVPVKFFGGLFSGIYSALYEAYQTTWWTVTVYVPREIRALAASATAAVVKAENYAQSIVASLGNQVAASINNLSTWAVSEFNSVERDITNGLASAEKFTTAAVAGVAATVAADLTKAESYALSTATSLFKTAETDLVTLGSKLTAEVTGVASALSADVTQLGKDIIAAESTAVSTALGVIATDIDKIVKPVTIELDDAIDAVVGVAATDFPDIMEWIDGIDLSKVVDIAGVAALSVATVGALTRYLEKCGLPNCRNLSALGRDLAALLGLVEDASFLEWIIELAMNPEQGAQDVIGMFEGTINATIDTGKSLLGI